MRCVFGGGRRPFARYQCRKTPITSAHDGDSRPRSSGGTLWLAIASPWIILASLVGLQMLWSQQADRRAAAPAEFVRSFGGVELRGAANGVESKLVAAPGGRTPPA